MTAPATDRPHRLRDVGVVLFTIFGIPALIALPFWLTGFIRLW